MKKAKKKAAKSTKKKTTDEGKSPLGHHREGSQGFTLDNALLAGGTVEQIASKAQVSTQRLRSHIAFLKAKHRVKIKVDKSNMVTVKR